MGPSGFAASGRLDVSSRCGLCIDRHWLQQLVREEDDLHAPPCFVWTSWATCGQGSRQQQEHGTTCVQNFDICLNPPAASTYEKKPGNPTWFVGLSRTVDGTVDGTTDMCRYYTNPQVGCQVHTA